ncbi:MAG: hypothetical protein WA989_10355, partial [Henriciella sp.]|uniref:hypothetical protein n=1 Tax=Henriciella sp. TaxID=1968823 RepID=UPI003C78F596
MLSRPALCSILCLVIGITSPYWLSAQESDSDEPSAAAEHMHEYLAYMTTIRAFITMGRLEGIRQPANWLATHEIHPDSPDTYAPYVEFMRSSARQIEKAEDLESAASAVAMMAQNCGNCHSASHVTVEFGYDQLPAEWSDSETHMQRHQWAVTRLWEGLIGPSDAAWERGTTMLSEDALHVDELPIDVTAAEAEQLKSMTEEVHALGRAAVGLTSPTDRGRVAGRILGLCAT